MKGKKGCHGLKLILKEYDYVFLVFKFFFVSLLILLTSEVVRPNLTRFGGSTPFWIQFLYSNKSGWPLGSKNGSNQFGLTSTRVQILVQPYNVPNIPTPFEPDQICFRVGLGPALGSKIGLSWIRLALTVKIWVGLVGFTCPH